MKNLNLVGQRLISGLVASDETTDELSKVGNRETLSVAGAGGLLTAAYEQIRNAAENAEEHLLIQNAIRRFYRRLIISRDDNLLEKSGEELIVELTFAGYIANNSITLDITDKITELAKNYIRVFGIITDERDVSTDNATRWVLDSLSYRIASLLRPKPKVKVFVDTAYDYYSSLLPDYIKRQKIRVAKDQDLHRELLAAIHKALLKSDNATVRSVILMEERVDVDEVGRFIEANQQIDAVLKSPLASNVYRFVDRLGAPLRVLRKLIEKDDFKPEVLHKREVFLEEYEKTVSRSYQDVIMKVNRAVFRSVLFLIITKVLIGLAVEIPYDIWAYSRIEWQPLLINLVFPPLYMIALRMTLNVPRFNNTTALVDSVDQMLYGEGYVIRSVRSSERGFGAIFSGIYAIFGLVVFSAVTWLLLTLHFSIVHIVIFFVFVSAASFLGFRISKIIRDLEVVRSSTNSLTFLRDMIYLPFVVVGRWMSEQYAQINIVALVLDMLIELPLKSILRIIREWGAFIDDRKDRI